MHDTPLPCFYYQSKQFTTVQDADCLSDCYAAFWYKHQNEMKDQFKTILPLFLSS